MTRLRLSNRDARRLWLAQNLLARTGPRDPLEIVRGLGFLQIDTIRNVVRAQDHILWSRAGAALPRGAGLAAPEVARAVRAFHP